MIKRLSSLQNLDKLVMISKNLPSNVRTICLVIRWMEELFIIEEILFDSYAKELKRSDTLKMITLQFSEWHFGFEF
jgi:hypothetical protein